MTARPRVSVLLPVCNGEAFLRQAIESLLAQTFTDFEIVAIDDGSTDASGSLLDSYAGKDGRIRVFHEPHHGLVVALNRGIELARGSYLARMDADDVCQPERLERQVTFLDAHPEVGVCGTWHEIIGGTVVRLPTADAQIRAFFPFENPIAHPSVVIRTAVLEASGLGYPDVPHAEDYALWTALAPSTAFANLPEALICYRDHGAKVSRVQWPAQRQSVKEIRRMQLQLLGVEPSSRELELHHAIAERPGSFGSSQCALRECEAWLRRLRDVNRRELAFDRVAFERVLALHWLAVCGSAAERTGLGPALRFWRSPLSRGGSLRASERVAPGLIGINTLIGRPDLTRRLRELGRRRT